MSPTKRTAGAESPSLLKCRPAAVPSLAPGRVRILLVDDHPVVRKGLCSCLTRQKNIEVIGEAGDGKLALGMARELRPDLILMDVDMPGMSGLAAAETLQKELPDIRILFLSMHGESDFVMRILQSGAKGYVLKHASPEELCEAIEKVHAGETYFSAEVAKVALNQFVQGQNARNGSPLTNRENEVLTQIAGGLSNKEIACRLGVGVRTVETHRERIMRKLDIHSVAGLTRFAISKGLVSVKNLDDPLPASR